MAEGGHLVAVVAGWPARRRGALPAVAYLIVLSLPALDLGGTAAADSYAHYATLPVGLLTLAAVVELGERSLPAGLSAKAEEIAGLEPLSGPPADRRRFDFGPREEGSAEQLRVRQPAVRRSRPAQLDTNRGWGV